MNPLYKGWKDQWGMLGCLFFLHNLELKLSRNLTKTAASNGWECFVLHILYCTSVNTLQWCVLSKGVFRQNFYSFYILQRKRPKKKKIEYLVMFPIAIPVFKIVIFTITKSLQYSFKALSNDDISSSIWHTVYLYVKSIVS